MNITLSTDPEVIEKARTWASSHGTSLSALVREYLVSLGNSQNRDVVAKLFLANARNSSGCSSDDSKPFSRAEIYSGKRFGQ